MNDATLISAVFEDVMGRAADFSLFEDRLKTQKIVYLLNELGVSCGNYSFRWYKHGPYSQQLQNIMLAGDAEQNPVVHFSEKGLGALEGIKQMLATPHNGYTDGYWLEAIGSIHYLGKYLYQGKRCETILLELQKNTNKAHLNNAGLNTHAYCLLKEHKLLS